MKRTLTVLLIFALVFTLFGLTAFASEKDPASHTSLNEAKSNESADTQESGLEEAYSLIIEHSDKILALFAFLASLILSFAYKKGLLPLVKNAIAAMRNGVAEIREQTKEANESSANALSEAEKKLSEAESVLTEISNRLTSLESALSDAEKRQIHGEELRIVLNSQIELLYEIFMSSSLPAYQKDSVGEKVAKMKQALRSETENE